MTSDDWKTVPLESIADFRNGVNYDKNSLGKGIKVIGVADFQDHISISFENLAEINPHGVVGKDDLLKDGDILFVRSNGNKALIGRSLYIDKLKEQVTFSGFTIRLRFTSQQVYPLFFAYFFKSQIIRRVFLELGGGTNISNLSQQILKGLFVHLPPLSEQHKITKILSTWDRAINLTIQLIAAKQQRKRELMQQLLTGKRRFSEFADNIWSKKLLGDLFSERRETGRADLPLLSITNKEGIIPRDSVERRDTSTEDKSKYLRICKGDVGYNTMRMWQGVSAVSSMEGIVSPAYTICIPSKHIDARFIGHLFKSPPMIHLFLRYSQGLVDDTLSLKFDAFSKIEITIPHIDEQKCIAKVLDACDNELSLLRRKLELLKKQKQGLMQQLLTGKVRVKV